MVEIYCDGLFPDGARTTVPSRHVEAVVRSAGVLQTCNLLELGPGVPFLVPLRSTQFRVQFVLILAAKLV